MQTAEILMEVIIQYSSIMLVRDILVRDDDLSHNLEIQAPYATRVVYNSN
jgi:hypothetical protein